MRFLATLLISLLAMNGGLSAAHASTPFTFSNLFTNHLVLQRGMKDPVWGWAKPRQKITVSFAGHTVTATANAHGNWMAKLPAMHFSAAPRSLTITSGAQTLVVHDVLVGDVWLCSGQSNMQYPMAGWFGRTNLSAALAKGTHANIRLYHVPMMESNFSGTPKRQASAADCFRATENR